MYVCMYACRRLGSNAQVAYCRRPQCLVDLSAIKGSPGWHRRERLRRSKARRRVHSARKAGRWPPSSALELLQQHHTKPQYRELAIPMGKRGGSGGRGRGHAYDGYSQAGWDYSGNSGRRQWNLWKGAWSPRHGRHSEERYDQVELKPQAHQSELGVSDGSLLSGIQRALTAAKKHDVRVRKLTEERQTRQKQFAQYTEDVKLKYAKQKKAFLEDMARIDEEQRVAAEAGHMAAAQVKALVAGRAPAVAPSPTLDRETAWKELWEATGQLPQPTGFLREALSAAGMTADAEGDLQATLGEHITAQSVKVVPGAEAFFGAPPGFEADSLGPPYAATLQGDPYMLSPTHRPPASSPDARHPTPAIRPRSRPRPHPYAEAGLPDDSALLEAKLRARREAEAETQDGWGTGVPPTAPPSGAPPALAAGKAMQAFGRTVINGRQRLARATIEDDDSMDELATEPIGGRMREDGT